MCTGADTDACPNECTSMYVFMCIHHTDTHTMHKKAAAVDGLLTLCQRQRQRLRLEGAR